MKQIKSTKGVKFDDAQLSSLIDKHKENKSVEGLAQILLEMGYDPSMLKTAKLKDVIAFQKHLLDKRKADMEEQKFQIALSKLMSGEVVFMDGIEEEAALIDREGAVDRQGEITPEAVGTPIPEELETEVPQPDGE